MPRARKMTLAGYPPERISAERGAVIEGFPNITAAVAETNGDAELRTHRPYTPTLLRYDDWMISAFEDLWNHFQHVGIAYLLTASIGWEREQMEHSTGVRTFPIVGMASCGYLLLVGGHPDSAAQSRLLQGLITGIGFIGGGAILKEGATVRGTATAASLWNAGVIGAAVAMDHYGIAVTLVLLNLFTLRGLLPLKRWLDQQGGSTTVPKPPGDILESRVDQ